MIQLEERVPCPSVTFFSLFSLQLPGEIFNFLKNGDFSGPGNGASSFLSKKK